MSDEEWNLMMQQGLLTPKEKEDLGIYEKQQHTQLLLYWSQDVIKEGLEQVKAPTNALRGTVSALFKIRKEQQELMDIMNLPIPFQYYHLLNAMVFMNLVLWGYTMAISMSLWASVIYFLSSLIFMGMMDLGNQLSDPFGEDEVDFPLQAWLTDLLVCSEVLLKGSYAGCEDNWSAALRFEDSVKLEGETDIGPRPPCEVDIDGKGPYQPLVPVHHQL